MVFSCGVQDILWSWGAIIHLYFYSGVTRYHFKAMCNFTIGYTLDLYLAAYAAPATTALMPDIARRSPQFQIGVHYSQKLIHIDVAFTPLL